MAFIDDALAAYKNAATGGNADENARAGAQVLSGWYADIIAGFQSTPPTSDEEGHMDAAEFQRCKDILDAAIAEEVGIIAFRVAMWTIFVLWLKSKLL